MDSKIFSEKSPGKLTAVALPHKDWAFIPDTLPLRWDFSQSLWPLLAEAREALGTLNGIGQILPDQQLLLRPLQNREAIASSKIEGTYVTPEQLLLYELDPREPKRGDEGMADWLEVFNYNKALQHGCQRLDELPICNRVILEMHEILMRGVRGKSSSPGEFRRVQVQIGSKGRFIPPPPTEVARLMDNLEAYINLPKDGLDPLVRAFIVHYQFEAIHPFRDGNGRIGRALLALMIYKWHAHTMPWLYLSAFFDHFREQYIEKLFQVSAKMELSEWIEFCLRATIAQARDSVSRCHQFHTLRNEFHQRIISPTPRTHQIIDHLFASPVVSVTSIAKRFDTAYMTAKTDLLRLCAVGILNETPNAQPRSYYSPEIMRIAYFDEEWPET